MASGRRSVNAGRIELPGRRQLLAAGAVVVAVLPWPWIATFGRFVPRSLAPPPSRAPPTGSTIFALGGGAKENTEPSTGP